jgi:hypothetical protein
MQKYPTYNIYRADADGSFVLIKACHQAAAPFENFTSPSYPKAVTKEDKALGLLFRIDDSSCN